MPCIEILSFATSCFTCHLLVLISKSSGESSFSQLGERFLGRAALVVPCLIVMNNLGVMIAFLEVSSPPCAQWWTAHTAAAASVAAVHSAIWVTTNINPCREWCTLLYVDLFLIVVALYRW